MSSPQTWDEERESLLKHLEGVFALAQVVAPDADEAVRLVEDTYRKAFASPPAADSDEERRVQLFRLLLQTRSSPSEGDGRTSESSPDLAGFRRRLAVEFIDHALPPAFAALPSEKRLILILSDVQGLDCRLAGEVLDLSEEAACARLDEARSDLRAAVYAGATEAERRLLETGLSESWEKDAVSRMADTELAALPPTLRPSILSAIRGDGLTEKIPASTQEPAAQSGSIAGSIIKRIVTIVLIVAVAGLLGYGFSHLMQRSPKASLIKLSASQAVEIEASFQTTSAEQAERYVYDRLGRRITVPAIDRAALQGVSIRDITDGAEVPVLVYSDTHGTGSVVVYIYSYAFLDQYDESLVLGRDILGQIEEEGNFDLHDLGAEKALVWRRSDDILVAITAGDAEELRRRIRYPA